jgi:hypothetical protein
MLLGVELVDEQITKLQLHIRVQHGWFADGRLVPQQEPVRLDLLFLYVGP